VLYLKYVWVSLGEHGRTQNLTSNIHRYAIWSCDLYLDPMTLIYLPNLIILKMYLHAKNELSRSRLSKVRTLRTEVCYRQHYDAAFAGGKVSK